MKTKLLLLSAILFILTSCVSSKPISGYWVGTMEMDGKSVDISLSFNSGKGVFSRNDLMLLEEPIRNLKMNGGDISFSITLDVEMKFEGVLENEKINGTVSIQGLPPNIKIGFSLDKKSATPAAKSYSIEKQTIKSNGVTLSAEIYIPDTKKLHPAIVLLQGSTENLKQQYTFYADFFARLGFETLIFDKRGNGESTGNYMAATYDDIVGDAIACLHLMKNRTTVDKSKIGLWGYSQGAMLLPLIVTRTDIPAFLIATSPEVVCVGEAAAYSDSLRVIRATNSAVNGHIAAASHRHVADMIRNGSDYKGVEAYINKNASEFSFMNQTGLYANLTINKNDFDGFYWKGQSLNFYSYWKNIKIKTLVLFGEEDEYVNAVQNGAIIKSFNNKKIEMKLFPRANHSLKKVFDPVKYPDFDWPRIIDGYKDFVNNWIENVIK